MSAVLAAARKAGGSWGPAGTQVYQDEDDTVSGLRLGSGYCVRRVFNAVTDVEPQAVHLRPCLKQDQLCP